MLGVEAAAVTSSLDQIFAKIVRRQEDATSSSKLRTAGITGSSLETRIWRKARKKDNDPLSSQTLSYYVRVGLAGGLAGATGTVALYPVDCAKTVRQSDPSHYSSVWKAFRDLIYDNVRHKYRIGRAYQGVIPAALGAVPSSALYFGAYESMKALLQEKFLVDRTKVRQRLTIHAVSAASGNILSSLVFVPKEVIKQQMQFDGKPIGTICRDIFRTRGIKGYYSGYQATLLRNIPSAVLRFVLYEELKWRWYAARHTKTKSNDSILLETAFSWRLFAAGAVAGAVASGFMTPIDVMKTRISTGSCPLDVPSCAQHILRSDGLTGLYAGAGSRMVWSGAFSAIGFCSLETAKGWLGVSEKISPRQEEPSRTTRDNVYSARSQRLGEVLLGEGKQR